MRALAILTFALLGVTVAKAEQHGRRERFQPLPYPQLLQPGPQPLLPGGFVMNVVPASEAEIAQTGGRLREIDRPRDVARAIVSCWKAPAPLDDARQEITVRMSFSRDGHVIGDPRIAYVSLAAGDPRRAVLERSVRDAIAACSPLRFTKGMASAIAGRIFAIRFAVNRRGEISL